MKADMLGRQCSNEPGGHDYPPDLEQQASRLKRVQAPGQERTRARRTAKRKERQSFRQEVRHYMEVIS